MELPKSVLDRIHKDFRVAEHKEIAKALSAYGEEPYQREQERVLLDLLGLADGDMKQVLVLLERARRDYRDIIFWAENPSESKLDTPEKIETFNKMLKRFGAPWHVPEGKEDA
jgi:hypothetical protein